MTPEERKRKEAELERLRSAADAAHQALAAKPDDEALQTGAEAAEDAYNALKAELDAAPLTPATEDGEDDDEDEDIDFEKELKDLEEQDGKPPASAKTELEKAQRALHFNAERVRKLGGDPGKVLKPKEGDVPPPEPADDRYVTKDDLAQKEATRLSGGNAAKAKVIMHHYKHSIQKTGNYEADIENAFYIANKGRIRRSIDEIRRADVRTVPGSEPGRRTPGAPRTPQLSTSDQSTMRRRGFQMQDDGTWESKKYVMKFVTGKGWVTEEKPKKKK